MRGPEQLVPGTSLPLGSLIASIHLKSKSAGRWDHDPLMSESLVQVVRRLATSVMERQFEVAPKHTLALAVVDLLDLAGRYHTTPVLWDGMDRSHNRYYDHMFGIMSRVLRLREDYPREAVQMIEKLAAQYVSRAEFWQLVMDAGVGATADEA